MNQVTILGNVANEGELKELAGGKKVLEFRIAVSGRPGKDKDKDDAVSYFSVECWDGLAQIVSDWAPKGREVAVTGRLVEDRWTADDMTNRSRVKIVAREVDLLRKPAGDKGAPAEAEAAEVAAVAAVADEVY
jgi:single-strand DNA-binding protein